MNKLLIAMEKGKLKEIHGMNLDAIVIDPLDELDVSSDEDEQKEQTTCRSKDLSEHTTAGGQCSAQKRSKKSPAPASSPAPALSSQVPESSQALSSGPMDVTLHVDRTSESKGSACPKLTGAAPEDPEPLAAPEDPVPAATSAASVPVPAVSPAASVPVLAATSATSVPVPEKAANPAAPVPEMAATSATSVPVMAPTSAAPT
ncbi:uncharacterized protein [Hoplias malabaricus]|uniref:uncharacterized protein n=1 Tax=Hoplias malabaricus TaxID=27720 RepID=UPI0034636BB5